MEAHTGEMIQVINSVHSVIAFSHMRLKVGLPISVSNNGGCLRGEAIVFAQFVGRLVIQRVLVLSVRHVIYQIVDKLINWIDRQPSIAPNWFQLECQSGQRQGRSQDFLLGGANLVKGPMPKVPQKLKTPRIWPTILWEGPKFTFKKKLN